MNPGEKCICQYDDWFNAFGETTTVVHRGMRLTVKDTHRVGGCTFLCFEETPEDSSFLSTGFKPLRSLN